MERETGMVDRYALINALEEYKITKSEATQLINQLVKEGAIYEPREGYLKKT
jgi:DNA replicative helicase MCM subunit Mcm2 (Cdc46/Mcm family)